MPGSACRPPNPRTPTSADCADRPATYPGRPPRMTGPPLVQAGRRKRQAGHALLDDDDVDVVLRVVGMTDHGHDARDRPALDGRRVRNTRCGHLDIIITAYQAFLDKVRGRDDVSSALVVGLPGAKTHRRADVKAPWPGNEPQHDDGTAMAMAGDDGCAASLRQPHIASSWRTPSPPATEWLCGPDPAVVASGNRAAAGCRAGQSDDRSTWSTGHSAMASLARRARHWTQRSTEEVWP
jgi:hypothetical protein